MNDVAYDIDLLFGYYSLTFNYLSTYSIALYFDVKMKLDLEWWKSNFIISFTIKHKFK